MASAASQPLYCPACDRPFADGTENCPTDGTRLVRITEDPLLGREIDGRFELRARIGAGGMGAVYRGWQRSVGRDVAVKVIRSHLNAEPFEIKRFMREAQLTSRLVHPNVVSVFDFGQTNDGLLYLAMELLPGQPLNKVLAKIPDRRLPPERVVEIGVQLCDALQVAHQAKIIHRDLKPSNIMVLDGPGDRIKVLDFGLARPLQGDHSTLTASDLVLGTPSYMSPEMVQNHDLDARSDLYSLGVVLYQLLSGKLPFGGDTRTILASKLQHEVPRLPDDIPPPLGNVILRLLQRDPQDRYVSAATTREALLAARSLSPPEREAVPELRSQPAPGRRWWWAGAVILLLAGVGIFTVARLKQVPARVEPVPAEVKPVTTTPSPSLPMAAAVVSPAPAAAPPSVAAPPSKAKVRRHKTTSEPDYIIP